MIMATEIIICPNCHFEIPLTEAITHQIKDGHYENSSYF